MESVLLSVEVKVKRRHIEAGEVGDCNFCPVALAIRDAIPGVTGVMVDGEDAFFVLTLGEYQSYNASLDGKVKAAINDYDYNGDMKPFKFKLKYRKSPDQGVR